MYCEKIKSKNARQWRKGIREIRHLSVASVLLALILPPAYAGDLTREAESAKIDTSLFQRLIDADDSTRFDAILIVKGQTADLPDEQVSLDSLSAAERYHTVREILEAQAREGQRALLADIEGMRKAGAELWFKSYWIANFVSVRSDAKSILKLSASSHVARIMALPKITGEKTEKHVSNYRGSAGSIEPNLLAVGVRGAWNAGYTGKGRIICSFDTGIDGRHPALRGNWKGRDGDSSAAWFDPVGQESFPHILDDLPNKAHGTHVMGIMVGVDTTRGDTIGVAPDARWISAAVIDIPGASIVDAFQWAADPDGDPNTFADVPDVINHSWGVVNSVMGCDDLFWRLIDNTEALGIVNIFSAGNEGRQGSATIRNPANRARNSADCFAVGNIDHRNPTNTPLEPSSSRGPSDCDNVSVKPNLTAPGVNIRSAEPGGMYNLRSGSSMSAPHVSAAVALLRQKNPNATPQMIKRALIDGARDKGIVGPDYDYGWGTLDIYAAIEALPAAPAPDLRVFSLTPNSPDENHSLKARVILQNVGAESANLTGVNATVFEAEGATVSNGHLTFETQPNSRLLLSAEELEISVSDSTTSGSVIRLPMFINTPGGGTKRDDLFVLVGKRVAQEFYTHQTDRLEFTISNFGEYGFADGSYTPLGFSGFRLDGEEKSSLFEMAFALAVDPVFVSDGIRNIGLEPDRDFAPAPGGVLIERVDSLSGLTETHGAFADTLAERPLGITVRQRSCSWDKEGADYFVALDYTLINQSPFSIGGLYAGLFADWDIADRTQNVSSFSLRDNLGYIMSDDAEEPQYRGIGCLNVEGLSGHYVQNMSEFGSLRNPFSEEIKFTGFSSGFSKASDFNRGDLGHFVSTGPFSLAPGDSVRATFLVIGGESLADLQRAMITARELLDSTIAPFPTPQPVKPHAFALKQNYPNPFNPGTTIEFSLPVATKVTLEIFNALGQKVRTLISGLQPPENYSIVWNGSDDSGEPVASGIYFYRLTTGEFVETRKMALIR